MGVRVPPGALFEFNNKAMTDDERFMLEALKEAQRAFEEGEVPVGAVVIYEGKIIGRGHNRTEALQDPTAHAEIIAITAAATYLNNWRLNGAKLYVTLEPCIMCAGAAVLARLDEIIYALPDPKFGGCVSLYRIPEDQRLNHRVKIRQGPFGDKVRLLMQEFFKQKRNKDR